ncbi:DUF7288 family protein [Haloplanus halophilus]|uniref:DUF7288 family protein n=1 Tax=Haloplanus halophilus TaxID=2949993 RepID=UPI00203CE8E8|nr:hypothetical protein [Haloplanus sp. GDY1]
MAGISRGQAFTLEGFVAAAVVLTSVVLALQTVVVPPDAGTANQDDSLRTQAEDILRTQASADGRDLTHAVRYWDPLRRTFDGAQDREVGYGNQSLPGALFGGAFERTFSARGLTYNVVLVYHRPGNASARAEPLLYQGTPGPDAVTARHAVTLYDDMTLTSPGAGPRRLDQYDADPDVDGASFYPIPDVVDGPVYNVVEVRVTVW